MAFRISPLQIGALAHAVRHYPENMQNRWKYIAEYITKRTEGMDLTKVINIGSDKNKRNFEVTALNCRAAYRCLLQHHKDFLHENVNFNNIFLNNDKNCHKPIIMCPPVDNCLLCKKTLRKRESMSFPIVYSEEGVTVAVSVHSRCDPCAVTFHYSYYEKGAKESSQEDRKRLYYYSDALEKKYFQVTCKTAFSIKYLEHVHNQISLGAMSFESSAQVYNATYLKDNEMLQNIVNFSRDGIQKWDLHEQRLEEAWFLFNLVSFFASPGVDTEIAVGVISADDNGRRRCVEDMCKEAYEVISTMKPKVRHWKTVVINNQNYSSCNNSFYFHRALLTARQGHFLPISPQLLNIITPSILITHCVIRWLQGF